MLSRLVGESVFHGVDGYLGARVEIQLDQYSADVILDRLLCQKQLIRDLAVGVSPRKE